MLNGSRDAVLVQIQPLDIHGTRFYDIAYTLAGEAQPRSMRLGGEQIYAEPSPGDPVRITFLMNVAASVTKA